MAANVTIKQFLDLVERQFMTGTMKPVLGIGKGGIGKTEGIFGVTQKLSIGFKEIRLLLYSEVDLVGIPVINPKDGTTNWARNSLFPTESTDGPKGILVLDEITSASQNIRTAAYQLLDSKRSIGNYKLPDGWLVVGLGNGEEDGGSFQGLEGNLINRCSMYRVNPSIESFKEWALGHDVNPMVIAFLTYKQEMLHNYNPEITAEQFASPRSWKALSDELNYNERNMQPFSTHDDLLFTISAGCVGDEAANAFTAFYDYKKYMINPEDILAGKETGVGQAESQVIHMAIQTVIKMFATKLSEAVARNKMEGAIVQQAGNLCKWIVGLERYALDYATIAISDLVQSCPDLSNIVMTDEFDEICPEYLEFSKRHRVVYKV